MFQSYIKLAYRSLSKNRFFSLINIFGLAIGLTCCMLIAMFLVREFSYDREQKFGDRLYQIGSIFKKDGKEFPSGRTASPLGQLMQQEFPEIESTTRILGLQEDKTLLQYNGGSQVQSIFETKGFIADENFFRLFSYNFKEGNPANALVEPNSVVISEDIARKIFGNGSALNKTIHINSNTNGANDCKVTGVFIPSKVPSHIDGRFFVSFKGGKVGGWTTGLTDIMDNTSFFSYVLLKPGSDPKKLEAKFPGFIDRHAGEKLRAYGGGMKNYLTPVQRVHLYGPDGNVTPGGSLSYLYIVMSIAIVTLLIACVNFMNLSTARSSKRAVEIGVRKVVGAERKFLIRQFLWEAILLALIAFLISLLLTYLLLPVFEQVTGKEFTFTNKQYIYLGVGFLIVTILAGLTAGIYPAFYLSAFKPVKVLKGRFSNSLAAITFRKALVVFQFFIAVSLIVASIAISNQMQYLRSRDLGFQKDQQVVIPLRTTTSKLTYPSLKTELATSSAIASTGAGLYYPGIFNVKNWMMFRQGESKEHSKDVFINFVDTGFLKTMGMQPVAGRIFSAQFTGDTAYKMVVNEQTVKDFGFKSPEDALGKSIALDYKGELDFEIVGVVKDFHFEGMQSKIKNYGFLLNFDPEFDYFIAHVNPGKMKEALATLSATWLRLNPNEPFEYSFIDQDFQKNYDAEERLASIIRYFTIIAIFISCLGLFALTAFSVEQRTKEIGIRKVLGASTAGILALISKDFLKLVFLSFVIAVPVAWLFVHSWLEDFAYKAPFSIWVVLLGCVVSLLIAFVTISLQAVRAALANPVDNLRTE